MDILEMQNFQFNSILTNNELNKVRGGIGGDLESYCTGDEESDRNGDGTNDDCVMVVDDGTADPPTA